MKLPEKITNVVDRLSRIPGVGSRTALRQALFLAKWDTQTLNDLSLAIKELGELRSCIECGLYSDQDVCQICSSESRKESGVICVVENISDCFAIEKSETFTGRYHILGGVLNPLMGVGPEELGIDRLIRRCHEKTDTLILAINSSVEGDATSSYIRQQLPSNINVERIGFGIPMGGSLEYLDSLTITKALENRKRMD